jgi:NADPH2:quinone reductase
VRENTRLPLPFVPGAEGSGVVDALGEDVTGFSVGDAVAWYGPLGSCAELAVVKAGMVVKVPTGVFGNSRSPYDARNHTFPLKAGDTALVHAAAGGVGSLLTQFASALGVRVLATVSTEEKAEIACDAGASELIQYRAANTPGMLSLGTTQTRRNLRGVVMNLRAFSMWL